MKDVEEVEAVERSRYRSQDYGTSLIGRGLPTMYCG